MKKINEEFLHFLWKNQSLAGIQLHHPDVMDIEVTDPGILNHDAGPDFFQAKVKIDGTLWVGNVELHINASDWHKHGHADDPLYDTVILHVVYFNDIEITRRSGEVIPAVVLRFPSLMWDKYKNLQSNGKWIPCQDDIATTESLHIAQWTSSLMAQRLMEKSETLDKNFRDLRGDWEASFSRMIFRGFGLPVNTTPFEILSLVIPFALLLRYKKSIFDLEAILFGQAGFLNTSVPHDKYVEGLRMKFQRISGRIEENSVPLQTWKFMRMRPSAFPSIRLAQLASLIHLHYPPHHLIESQPQTSELMKLLKVRASDYWNNHFLLGKESDDNRIKYTGSDFIQRLIINAIAPYAFYFGKKTGKPKYCDYAIGLLEEIPAENNVIIKKWGKFGIKAGNAFESQALLFLHKNYCTNNRCLDCQFGNNVILNDHNKE